MSSLSPQVDAFIAEVQQRWNVPGVAVAVVRRDGPVFVEYVGDYPENSSPSQLFNSGGSYHLSPTQQVDFHIAFGLNRNAPSYIVGIGYSFRIDGLFVEKPR